jgi:excisionase family DNA binding protein
MSHQQQQHTVREAAARLGVSRHALYVWIRQGRIGHVRLGRAIRIPSHEIARILDVGFRAAVGSTVKK